MSRNYVALPYEYLAEMEELDDEEFGRLCRGLLRYSMEGVPIPPEGNLRFFCRRVMGREDRFQESFEEQRRKRSEAGKKAASVRWGKSGASEDVPLSPDSDRMPTDSKGMPTDAQNGNTDTKADTDTKTDTEAETESKANPLPATAGERGGPSASAPRRADRPTREQVWDYIREKGLNVDGARFWDYYQAQDWRTRNGRPVDWRKRAESWARTQRDSGGQVVPLRPSLARQQAENRANIEEMRRALEQMRASG
ncbi:MAG: DUF6291 domain-containing protein [Clostridiales bacterium]|nr:DUF6291 domain-containing protein [Clostridiales bacterium]